MDPAAKAKFILALHKHSLEAFDSGGTVLGGPGTSSSVNNATNPNSSGVTGVVGDVLGLNNNFQGAAAQLQPGTNVGQLNESYNSALGGIRGQQNFVDEANKLNGFGNQFNTFQQQQALANQLQQQTLGQGPNPAQAALAQNTGQNIANQGALMASQRGAGANVGLIARQAAQQGAGIQQQSVGQAATLQAQQQLAAQSALANQQAQMQQVAANQVAAQGQAATNLSNAQQNEQNILQGSNTAFNNAAVSQQSNINNVNSQTSQGNQAENQNIFGGITSGIGAALGLAKGGEVKKYADGGVASPTLVAPALAAPSSSGPISFAGQWLNSSSPAGLGGGPNIGAVGPMAQLSGSSWGSDAVDAYKSAKDSKTPSIGGDEVTPEWGSTIPVGEAKGGRIGRNLEANGGKVKADGANQKAVKKDNSYSNDKIPAVLSEGEIVLPRKVTMHPNAPEKAAEFVRAVLAKKRMGKK